MVNQRKRDLGHLALVLLVIIGLNFLFSTFFFRIDFTKEKRYTLSPVTQKILNNLQGDIQVTVYLQGDLPAGFRRLKNATQDILVDFKAYSKGNFQVDWIDPLSGDSKTQEKTFQDLISKGIEPTFLSVKTEDGLTQKNIFPEALITYNGKQMVVKLLQTRSGSSPEEVLNNSIQNLEYAFISALKKISSGGKPRIGFTEGHHELSDLQLNDAMKSLSDGYEVGRVNLKTISLQGLDGLRLLVIPKPDQAFTEAEKYKIDYFVMHGGRVLWALDKVSAELDSLRGSSTQYAFPKDLNLDDILFKYGIRINDDLIADMNCAQIPIRVGSVGGQAQMQLVPWLFYPIFVPVSKHPLVKNLDGIRGEFASTLDTIATKNVHKEIILTSSPFSKKLSAPALLSLQMVEQEPDPKAFQSTPKPVGILLEGSFASDFKNRPVPNDITTPASIPFTSKKTKMIVISDGDILKNQVSGADGSAFPLGYDRYTHQQFGNKSFLLNMADYLTDDSDLIQLRNKEIKLRLLDRARIRDEKSLWQAFNMGLPLFLLLIFVLLQQYYRKRKYTS
jgi:ABC-2 type transport system permease protein